MKISNLKSGFLTLILLITLHSCYGPIKPENRITTIAKIVSRPVAERNGAKAFSYFFKGKEYKGSWSFDARNFTYGDKFLIDIDKNNPNNCNVSKNIIKINSLDDFHSKCKNCYIKEEDYKMLEMLH